MSFVYFSQIDPIGGPQGWVGAGLLGTVLAWLLLKHLPDKDKLITKLVEDKDKIIASLVESFRQETAQERTAFSQTIDKITASIEYLAGHRQSSDRRVVERDDT